MHGKTVIIQFEHDEQRHITKISYIMRPKKGIKFNVNDAKKKKKKTFNSEKFYFLRLVI